MNLRPNAADSVTRVVNQIKAKLDMELGPMALASHQRPANFFKLSSEQQWEIDKHLGILDWDGDPHS